jgi:hypothetical protein
MFGAKIPADQRYELEGRILSFSRSWWKSPVNHTTPNQISPVKWEDTGIMTPDSFEEGGVEGGYEVSTKRRGGSQGYVSR